MNKTEKLSLIEGDFNADEAWEVLLNVFNTKIHFHEMKDFSSKERFGIHDESATKRIQELKRSLEILIKKVEEGKLNNKKLKITSEIKISLLDE